MTRRLTGTVQTAVILASGRGNVPNPNREREENASVMGLQGELCGSLGLEPTTSLDLTPK